MGDIFNVVISKNAQKDLRKIPIHCLDALSDWVMSVKTVGIRETRKCNGYNDEALKGEWKGYRSIRLSYGYRAFYLEKDDGVIEFISVERVNKHVY